MTLDALIMLLGAFVALLPFLGFPNNWDTVLFLIAGIIIVVLGIVVRRRGNRTKQASDPMPRAFAENSPQGVRQHDTEH